MKQLTQRPAELQPITKPKPWVKRFLKALAESGNVAHAAQAAKVARTAVYRERDTNPVFAAQWEDAHEIAMGALEAEARRRAVEGIEVPIFTKDGQMGTMRKYSDTLLMFLLKAGKPHVYRENVRVEHELGPNATSTAAALIEAMREEAAARPLLEATRQVHAGTYTVLDTPSEDEDDGSAPDSETL